jgi:hypothetical protein
MIWSPPLGPTGVVGLTKSRHRQGFSMQIRYRRAQPRDVARAWPTVRSDWGLFPRHLLPQVPDLIADLIRFDRLTMCVFEDRERGAAVTIGGFGCLPGDFFERAAQVQGRSVLEQAFELESRAEAVFLGPRQVAHSSATGALEIISFLSTPPDSEDFNRIGAVVYDAFQFFVKGHGLRAMWQENASPHGIDTLILAGYEVRRQFERPTGETVTLLRATDSGRPPLSFTTATMVGARPVLGLSDGERRLLEYALLDFTDQEAAAFMEVTADAVKKRWRAIHAKVARRLPALVTDAPSAAARRRAILGHARQHLEELRPFAEASPSRRSGRAATTPPITRKG